jgi:hypothetical protein
MAWPPDQNQNEVCASSNLGIGVRFPRSPTLMYGMPKNAKEDLAMLEFREWV